MPKIALSTLHGYAHIIKQKCQLISLPKKENYCLHTPISAAQKNCWQNWTCDVIKKELELREEESNVFPAKYFRDKIPANF